MPHSLFLDVYVSFAFSLIVLRTRTSSSKVPINRKYFQMQISFCHGFIRTVENVIHMKIHLSIGTLENTNCHTYGVRSYHTPRPQTQVTFTVTPVHYSATCPWNCHNSSHPGWIWNGINPVVCFSWWWVEHLNGGQGYKIFHIMYPTQVCGGMLKFNPASQYQHRIAHPQLYCFTPAFLIHLVSLSPDSSLIHGAFSGVLTSQGCLELSHEWW